MYDRWRGVYLYPAVETVFFSALFFTCADKQNKVLNKQNEKKNKNEMSKNLHQTKIQFDFN